MRIVPAAGSAELPFSILKTGFGAKKAQSSFHQRMLRNADAQHQLHGIERRIQRGVLVPVVWLQRITKAAVRVLIGRQCFQHGTFGAVFKFLPIQRPFQRTRVALNPATDTALHFFRKRFHFRHPFPTAFQSRKDFSILPDDYSCKNTTGSRAISSACFSGMV